MSTFTSQPQDEVTSITSRVKSLKLDPPSTPQTTTICHSCRPRCLSLSPYKRAASSLDHWDRATEDLLEIPPTPPKNTDNDDGMSDEGIFHLELDESEQEEEIDAVQNAEDNILGALRCYMFNLRMGNLVTGDKVDTEVATTLHKLLSSPEKPCESLRHMENIFKDIDELEISDEQRLVTELENYIRKIRENAARPSKDTVSIAIEIIEWSKEQGVTTGEEWW
ncbi:hypothetical protein VTL71DRAFT_8707 [Oculimacula yallundae]|uniref:Uncharacterized protein n=1 Tax=Oculimacula yallundae TaxID=86028 RepID=A0ABR4CZC9_9HELO